MTLTVDILKPKAKALLESMADQKLISIQPEVEDGFISILKKLRAKGAKAPISLSEITKEVETVRTKRYASKK